MSHNSNPWNRVQRIGARLGTDTCELCGHQIGVTHCWTPEQIEAIDRDFQEALAELVEKANRGNES